MGVQRNSSFVGAIFRRWGQAPPRKTMAHMPHGAHSRRTLIKDETGKVNFICCVIVPGARETTPMFALTSFLGGPLPLLRKCRPSSYDLPPKDNIYGIKMTGLGEGAASGTSLFWGRML